MIDRKCSDPPSARLPAHCRALVCLTVRAVWLSGCQGCLTDCLPGCVPRWKRLDWRVSDVLRLLQALASSCSMSEGFPGRAGAWPVSAGASNNNSGLGGGL